MKAKVCNVWLIDEKKQEFNIKATQSMHQEFLNKKTIKLNEGIVGLVAREKKPKLIYDVLKEEQYEEKKLARSTIANQAAVAIEKTELIVKTKIIQEELDTRKKTERAKGILMEERNINENEAFSLIRKSSMDKRISMKEIAEAIILSYEIRQIK